MIVKRKADELLSATWGAKKLEFLFYLVNDGRDNLPATPNFEHVADIQTGVDNRYAEKEPSGSAYLPRHCTCVRLAQLYGS